jgi:hypothetical protein
MPLLVLTLCAVAVTGQAQSPPQSIESFGPPFSTFAEVGKILCVSWPPPVRPQKGFTSALYFDEATKHAWVYGFVVGAAHVSEERFARVNAETVDAWMDTYCAKNPRVTIGYAAAFLVEDLSRMR